MKTYRLPEHQANVLTAFFAVVILLVGSGLLYFSSTRPRPDPRLSSGGQVTQGVVLNAPELYVDNWKEVTYRFTTEDGRVIDGHDWVLAPTIRERRELQAGLTVPVRYLPEDPTVNQVDTGRSTTNGLTPLVGGTFSLVGGWLLARSVLRERRRRRAGTVDPSTSVAAVSHPVADQPLADRPVVDWPTGGAVVASAGTLPPTGTEDGTGPRLGSSRAFWCAAIPFACSLVVLLWLVNIAVQRPDPRLAADGRVVEGTVVHVDNTTVVDGRKRATYQFRTPDGQVVEGQAWARDSLQRPLRPGVALPIRYVPGEPTVNRVEGEPDGSTNSYGFLPFVLILAGLTGYATWRSWRQLQLERRLLLEGVQAEATVTEVREGRAKWRLRYRYQDHLGATHERGTEIRDRQGVSWEVGDVGTILYDRDRPGASVWVRRVSSGTPAT